MVLFFCKDVLSFVMFIYQVIIGTHAVMADGG